MSTRLPDLDQHLDDPARKRAYNRQLFDLVAPRYDRFTRWFSFGMDRRWKRALALEVGRVFANRGDGAVVLDLACGTGDLIALLWPSGGPAIRAVGLDLSPEMLAIARRRFRPSAGPPVDLVCGDMATIPLPAASVDLVTIGYGLRNAPALDGVLSEATRVLRPGGRLVSLDFFLPENRLWRPLFVRYLRAAGRVVGRLWHGDPAAYGYIAASLRRWCTARALSGELTGRGFEMERVRTWLAGGIALHVARRRVS